MARAKELEDKERANIRRSLEADHAARRPHAAFSEDPDVNQAETILARDEEERIGFTDDIGDNVDLVIDEDSAGDGGAKLQTKGQPYRDEFTDNDSDVFRDGDGTDDEAYGLHSHARRAL